mmetsp:Transcript_19795/g.53338  ORF Transcript_19795/g.53338 Transcript_19795/m.53338 type:complete len:298 (-) Transcript_19795:65-958(-)
MLPCEDSCARETDHPGESRVERLAHLRHRGLPAPARRGGRRVEARAVHLHRHFDERQRAQRARRRKCVGGKVQHLRELRDEQVLGADDGLGEHVQERVRGARVRSAGGGHLLEEGPELLHHADERVGRVGRAGQRARGRGAADAREPASGVRVAEADGGGDEGELEAHGAAELGGSSRARGGPRLRQQGVERRCGHAHEGEERRLRSLGVCSPAHGDETPEAFSEGHARVQAQGRAVAEDEAGAALEEGLGGGHEAGEQGPGAQVRGAVHAHVAEGLGTRKLRPRHLLTSHRNSPPD